jgi:hypothetical protein
VTYFTRFDHLENVEVLNLIKQETSQIVGQNKKRQSRTSDGHNT